MNANHDNMIERYLDGTMAPSERQEFLSRAESDPALNRTLQAERLIRQTARQDRAAAAGPSPQSRERFLSMLAAVSAEQGITPQTDAPQGPPARTPLRYIPGRRLVKGAAGVIAAGLLLAGSWMLVPDGSPNGGKPGNGFNTGRTEAPAGVTVPQQLPQPATISSAPEKPAAPAETQAIAPATGENEGPTTVDAPTRKPAQQVTQPRRENPAAATRPSTTARGNTPAPKQPEVTVTDPATTSLPKRNPIQN